MEHANSASRHIKASSLLGALYTVGPSSRMLTRLQMPKKSKEYGGLASSINQRTSSTQLACGLFGFGRNGDEVRVLRNMIKLSSEATGRVVHRKGFAKTGSTNIVEGAGHS